MTDSAEEPIVYTIDEMAQELDLPENLIRKAAKGFPYEERGTHRKRYYSAEVMAVIGRQIRRERARRRQRSTDDGAAYWSALAALGVTAAQLAAQSRKLKDLSVDLTAHFKRLRRHPPRVTLPIQTLADPNLVLISPLMVLVSPLRKIYWRARWIEAGLEGTATSPEDAVLALRERISEEYLRLKSAPNSNRARWDVLRRMIRRR
jgi:hypothetical protein